MILRKAPLRDCKKYFSEAEISNMENDVREDESNFENRFRRLLYLILLGSHHRGRRIGPLQ